MMGKLKRYKPSIRNFGKGPQASMREDTAGEYVRYEDLAKLIHENKLLTDQRWREVVAGDYDLRPQPVSKRRLEDLERAEDRLISDRDYWEEKATELANDVGKHLGIDVGEHSNLNCPVQNAIDALHTQPPAPAEPTEAMIATLEQRISAHNERCREDCQAYTNLDCVDARNKGLTCERCPQHFLIED